MGPFSRSKFCKIMWKLKNDFRKCIKNTKSYQKSYPLVRFSYDRYDFLKKNRTKQEKLCISSLFLHRLKALNVGFHTVQQSSKTAFCSESDRGIYSGRF